jgi:uncharacterized membrane protein YccC
MELYQAWATLIKDIVTIAATIVAAGVAVRGYQTWKKQLHWKTQYELAQRLAKATYKARDALASVRNPFIDEREQQQAMKEANIEGSPTESKETFIRSQRAIYQKRWQKVVDVFAEIDTIRLEAEAIWGQAAKENLIPLTECASTLLNTIRIQLGRMEHPEILASDQTHRRERQIIYVGPDEKDNFFSDEITQAVRRIENFLRPYLKI